MSFGETKFLDLDLDIDPISINGSLQPTINTIEQGVDENERLGRKVTITSIHWNYVASVPRRDDVPAGPKIDGAVVRVMLYLDKQCNGTTASVSNILKDTDYLSHRELSQEGRFEILYEKVHVVKRPNLTQAGNNNKYSSSICYEHVSWMMNCFIPIEFDDSKDPGITRVMSNNIGVLAIAHSSNPESGIFSKIRIRFIDE